MPDLVGVDPNAHALAERLSQMETGTSFIIDGPCSSTTITNEPNQLSSHQNDAAKANDKNNKNKEFHKD